MKYTALLKYRLSAIGLSAMLLPITTLTLALVVRLYGLETQSMWADEGGTLALAARSPTVILRDTLADVHPPLYYWILHFWMQLFGTTVAGARGFSAVCGALAAMLTALLARRWYGTQVGWLAGVIALFSPIGVYYSQEARMYALAMLLAVALFLALDDWLAHPKPVRLGVYWLLALALLATHYVAVTIVVAAALVGCVRIVKHVAPTTVLVRRTLVTFMLVHMPLAAVYLYPVLVSQQRLTSWTATKNTISPWFILSDLVTVFSLGLHPSSGWNWWVALFIGVLIVGLVMPNRKYAGWDVRITTLIWLGLPIAAMMVLSLNQPYYQPRFLLPVLPAFQMLVAAGAVGLVAWLGRKGERSHTASQWAIPNSQLLFPTCLILLISLPPIWREWNDPTIWRDEYRGAAATIAQTIGADDALILNGQSQIDTLDYYLRMPQPLYLVPQVRPIDPAAVVAQLEQLATRHRRIYGLFYVLEESDPNGVIAGWLDRHAFASGSRWYGDILLRSWETGDLTDTLRQRDAQFAGGPTLTRVAFDSGPFSLGDAIRIQFEWRGTLPADQIVNLFVHVVDAEGQIIAQYDGPAMLDPMTTAGQSQLPWTRNAAVLFPQETTPGTYRVVAGLYNIQSSERLRLVDGAEVVELGMITVRRDHP